MTSKVQANQQGPVKLKKGNGMCGQNTHFL